MGCTNNQHTTTKFHLLSPFASPSNPLQLFLSWRLPLVPKCPYFVQTTQQRPPVFIQVTSTYDGDGAHVLCYIETEI